ncbi:hypothetical protein B0H19DRAFT_1259932 [Mycena capillaripes]|nr:hypothetical protein B0H19DRAFT_1259932 [Mycena capillaripes]
MTLIQSFPPEILSEIFEELDFYSATFAALVCRQWHIAATGDSALWLTFGINNSDIERPDVIREIFQRSKGRPISLSLRFPATETPINYEALFTLLRKVVRKHVHRCVRLFVYAHQEAWRVIVRALPKKATFPWLLVLHLQNDDAVARWQIPRRGVPSPVPPADLVFPLPDGHQLWDIELQGVCLGDPQLPNLACLKINHDLADIVLDDGSLNPWLWAHASELLFQRMCVPALDYPRDTDIEEAPPALQHLVLCELCATPLDAMDVDEDGEYEYDCGPFFCALNTTRVRSLYIDTLDLDGRIWDDFILALSAANSPKFPLATELKLRQMDFVGMHYEHIALFLWAFPALERFLIIDCFHENGGTWQDVIETLEMYPALCVGLRELEVDDGIILRDDPMPFREFMFNYDLPLE